jgi:hypothetical protein
LFIELYYLNDVRDLKAFPGLVDSGVLVLSLHYGGKNRDRRENKGYSAF